MRPQPLPTQPPHAGGVDLRERLRRRTRRAHEAVDAAFAGFDLHSPGGYGRFLQAHAAALPPLEAAAEAAGAAGLLPDWPERRRTPALLEDLRALGLAPPPPVQAPDLSGPDRLLGALYVLEGSRLGARLLLARVGSGPHARLHAATAYLAHGGGRRFWPSFLGVLAGFEGEADRAVGGALDVFAVFQRAAARV